MNKKGLTIAIVSGVLVFFFIQKFVRQPEIKGGNPVPAAAAKFYFTCPMHPQIHSDHPGECPICHMKLVKVIEQVDIPGGSGTGHGEAGDKRSSVQVTPAQLELVGVQKQEVEKMTLTATIPVSGRLLSSTSVAFQVYETDVRYIHSGLLFRGRDSLYAEEELSGTIASVDTIVDPTSRTVRVVGVFPRGVKRGTRGLIAETSFRGEIKIEIKDRLAIPESAVLHTGQGELVYLVVNGNKLIPKRVILGIKAEGFYEVLSGLNEGDFISSGPNFLVDSEAKIRGTSD